MTTPLRPTDDEARALTRRLIAEAPFAALAFRDPETGAPGISRIGIAAGPDCVPMTVISALSGHTRALRADPEAALLLGEPGVKGDPLTHPRVSLQVRARFFTRDDPDHDQHMAAFLAARPKAKLYAGFADFSLVRFQPLGADLNGGFGQAFRLTAEDLEG